MMAAAVVPIADDFRSGQINTTKEPSQIVEEIVESKATEKTQTLTTEERVREYFKDTPIMIDVARCESQFRQHDVNGNVLRGIQNSKDVGTLQINEKYHLDTAQRLGINIYTLEGNLEYGRYLYETQGTAPWVHSSKCWGKTRQVAIN